MNEPIINPWFFYWLATLDKLGIMFTILAIVSLLITSASTFVGLMEGFFYKSADKNYKRNRKYIIILWLISIILLLISIFIPSEKVLYQMFIAKNITYERIDKTIAISKNIKDEIKKDILDIIKEVNKDEKRDK
jgi:heme/copper-type cytochrome/quinol oxidase subunit 2